jgi:Rv2525c-like, glycoside hydrolase-like domain
MAIQRIPTGKIVDTRAKLTSANVLSLVGAGYSGVVRYVPLPGLTGSGDIDAVECQAIVTGGLGLMLVQHSRYPGWNPAAHKGAEDAAAALERASAAGYLPGAHIFVDLEGIKGTAHATIVYANEWADAIVSAGYRAGCYVGYQVPLTPIQLYDLHDVDSYWSDFGQRSVATRGFAIKQHQQTYIDGLPFDLDDVAPDHLGETPFWLIGDGQGSAAD